MSAKQSELDIVDAQVHVGRAAIAQTIEAMDALGIRSVMIDEFWGYWDSPEPTHIPPGHKLPNGAWRAAYPTAWEASLLHPDRFAYVVRIDRRDPQLESVMRVAGSSPGVRAVRIQPVWTVDEAAIFAAGGYDAVFALAADIGMPISIFAPGYAELLADYARRFPAVRLILDHCGMGFPNIPPGRPEAEARRTLDVGYFDTVLDLARHPNIHLKWSHAQSLFGAAAYPYEPLRPLLRKAIDAFGASRVMWGSDKSVAFGHSWADLLYAVRDDPGLTVEETGELLGGTARRVFGWPKTSVAASDDPPEGPR